MMSMMRQDFKDPVMRLVVSEDNLEHHQLLVQVRLMTLEMSSLTVLLHTCIIQIPIYITVWKQRYLIRQCVIFYFLKSAIRSSG